MQASAALIFLPEVNDSNGLTIVCANSEELWRDLDNPRWLATGFFSEQDCR
ncbi:glucan biosynthesis protein [Nitratireductor basaltis]|uniref:glucan biosynthesis protein n=1 Tax=Nitratireductor basaltis TaxID=472175 RepID=UPI000AB3BB24